jgi:hypothetical protein
MKYIELQNLIHDINNELKEVEKELLTIIQQRIKNYKGVCLYDFLYANKLETYYTDKTAKIHNKMVGIKIPTGYKILFDYNKYVIVKESKYGF